MCESPGVRLLCPTRWTIRAAALTSISENYLVLTDTFSLAQSESKESEMHARLGGVLKQMETVDFFLGIGTYGFKIWLITYWHHSRSHLSLPVRGKIL